MMRPLRSVAKRVQEHREEGMKFRNVTVFGGSGFLGRYLVKRLAGAGVRVRVAVRDPEAAQFLKPMGDVGQVVPMQANIRNEESIRRAIDGAEAVVNAIGILFERGRQRFDAVHAQGAGLIAAIAQEVGATRLVHISAIGADPDSPARYGRSKWAGETAVREAFPEATIVRPSIMFGPEDSFFNRFGALAPIAPALPLIGGGRTRFQPVYVGDVAEAMFRMLEQEGSAGQVYELGGPRIYDFKELMQLVLVQTGRRCLLVPWPFALAKINATFLQLLPHPLLTTDQVELLKRDNIVAEDALGFAALDIQPTTAEAILPSYMFRYRRGGKPAPTSLA